MKGKTTRLIITILALFLLCGVASAASITNCDITNTNVYAESNRFDIAPSGYYDSTTTATGITNVNNRWIYATGLIASPNPAFVNDDVTFTIQGQQGASVIDATTKAEPYYAITYETGVTGNSLIHPYTTIGTKTAQLTKLQNPAGLFTTVLSTTVTILAKKPDITDLQPEFVEIPLGESFNAQVTASSATGSPLTYQWYVSTDQSSYTVVSGQTSSQLTLTPSATGDYYFKVVVSSTGMESADSVEEGFPPVHVSVFSGLQDGKIKTLSDLTTWREHYEYYSDKTLTLDADLTLANTPSIPEFAGVLNGNSHSIKNSQHALIDVLSGIVQNVNFEDCLIQNADYGGLLANKCNTVTIENVNAYNCNIKANNAGAITGAILGTNSLIRNCNVDRCTVIGGTAAGGVTSVTQSDTIVQHVSTTKCDIISNGRAYGVSP